jgi:pyruvate/2-oxoglutarate/acetoin dehydrogenase E1 component/TPP-dependent pyruvate/acetoin dehydrogenase alpha subunit
MANSEMTFQEFQNEILNDYRIAYTSRVCSILGRKEVLLGRSKFGIFGDGKELPQIAMSKFFRKGDYRSGYYRDQTLLLAQGLLDPKSFFHTLFGTTDLALEPMHGGRQMTGHFSSPMWSKESGWLNQTERFNSISDISSTAGQMPRLLGLAQASSFYRMHHEQLRPEKFSVTGNEIAWGTIGNASTSEGLFFEVMNAAAVMQVPLIINVWDDEYGISVPSEYHTVKQSISKALKGFKRNEQHAGIEIIEVKGWDYGGLIEAYQKAEKLCRKSHIPVLVHVTELTQPQGHSTSGSHERYKTDERLQWERDNDCLKLFKSWIVEKEFASKEELERIENEIELSVAQAKKDAFEEFQTTAKYYRDQLYAILTNNQLSLPSTLKDAFQSLKVKKLVLKRDVLSAAQGLLTHSDNDYNAPWRAEIIQLIDQIKVTESSHYSSDLIDDTADSLLKVATTVAVYADEAPLVDGRQILQENFKALLSDDPRVVIFGEDTGKIGGVNKALEGLQEYFGESRVFDTSIREASIIGQGIGLAMRGLRPIAEIQYLDYIFYAINILTDDLATLRYRSVGQQVAPLIIRTRGHRLEGIWHSGSPMGGLVHLLRGIYILSPRNMTQAAGMYNALLKANEPGLIIEPLNAYRLKERLPKNLGKFTVPIGVVEYVHRGTDITVVSYGSTLRIVQEVIPALESHGISIELIDVQTLWPFDVENQCVESVKKTNRLAIIDEDVPGGYSGYLLQQILEKQGGYRYLDSKPVTLCSKEHRPAYGSDGDYFSKPNAEEIFKTLYQIMHEANPHRFPSLF